MRWPTGVGSVSGVVPLCHGRRGRGVARRDWSCVNQRPSLRNLRPGLLDLPFVDHWGCTLRFGIVWRDSSDTELELVALYARLWPLASCVTVEGNELR